MIHSIDINGKKISNDLFEIYKTNSIKSDTEISEKIKSFKNSLKFVRNYSNPISLYYLHILDELKNIPEIDNEIKLSKDSLIENYLYNLTQIIISLKLLTKIEEITIPLLINSKNKLNEIKNKIKNNNHDILINYIDSLISYFENNIGNISYTNNNNYLSAKKTSDKKTRSTWFSDKLLELHFNSKSLSNIATPKINPEKEREKDNPEFTLDDNISFKSQKNVINSCEINEGEIIEKENVGKNYKLRELLEMVSVLYRKAVINSEEKIKLKNMVMIKSKLIINFYDNYFVNFVNQKITLNILSSEIHKIIDKK